MAVMDSVVDRDNVYIARAKVSAAPERRGTITVSIDAKAQDGGHVFMTMSPLDAELLAALLLKAATSRRMHDDGERE